MTAEAADAIAAIEMGLGLSGGLGLDARVKQEIVVRHEIGARNRTEAVYAAAKLGLRVV